MIQLKVMHRKIKLPDSVLTIISFPADSDYSAILQTLTLSSESSRGCIQLFASNDSVLEREETLLVHLSSPSDEHVIVIPNQAVVIIHDQTGI